MLTPYYEQDGITIYHGDCRGVLSALAGECDVTFDVLITDPPYGIEGGSGGDARDFKKGNYASGSAWVDDEEYIRTVCAPAIEELLQVVERAAVTSGLRHMWLYPRPDDIGCFWTPAAATHGPWGFTTFQPVLYYGRDFRAGKGAWPTGRLLTEAAEKNGHPCPKPIGGWTWLLLKVARQSDVIIDPFAGSGTTLVAAKRNGRKAIGIEIEERYCEIAAKRLEQGALPLEMGATVGAVDPQLGLITE